MSGPAEGAEAGEGAAREAYIYYRIDAAVEPVWRDQLNALHEQLRRRHPALRTGLLRRTSTGGAEVTLMETYALAASEQAIPDLDELLAEVEARCAALPGCPAAPRHLEVFERCA